jgi:hypothetical protein
LQKIVHHQPVSFVIVNRRRYVAFRQRAVSHGTAAIERVYFNGGIHTACGIAR